MRRFPSSTAFLAAALLLAAPDRSAAQAGGPPEAPVLTADTAFPALEQPFTVTLEGQPSATWGLLFSLAPAEIPLGAKGTLFVDPAATPLLVAATGLVPAGGTLDLPFVLPNDPLALGLTFYVQGAVKWLDATRLGNALAFRVGDAPPSGPRRPVAVAASPDGSRVFVAHEGDDSLTVLDGTTGEVLGERPTGRRPTDVAVDADGRHAFVVNGDDQVLTVLDVATLSVVAQVPVPAGCRRVTSNGTAGLARLYVTNAADHVVLVLDEGPAGTFTSAPSLALSSRLPGDLVTLPDGRLAVAGRQDHVVEILDPDVPGGATDAVVAVGGPAEALSVSAGLLRVALVRQAPGATSLAHQVVTIDPSSGTVTDTWLEDVGTDYVGLATSGSSLAVVASGNGTLVIADASTGATSDLVDLAPGDPVALPQRVASGAGGTFWVTNLFRETVRRVDVGPPAILGPEIALGRDGTPRLPLVDLDEVEDGEWFFRSVSYFLGTAATPNDVTCATCHPRGGTDHRTTGAGIQVPHVFEAGSTAPYRWTGTAPDLLETIENLFFAHGVLGGAPTPQSIDAMAAFLTEGNPAPASPFLEGDGSLPPEAEQGRVLFETTAGCGGCHQAPLFIPGAPPLTISGGVGTGLAPANVPSLVGLWATGPWLHDGAAATLEDVLLLDVADQHGTPSALSAGDREALVAYLRTL